MWSCDGPRGSHEGTGHQQGPRIEVKRLPGVKGGDGREVEKRGIFSRNRMGAYSFTQTACEGVAEGATWEKRHWSDSEGELKFTT